MKNIQAIIANEQKQREQYLKYRKHPVVGAKPPKNKQPFKQSPKNGKVIPKTYSKDMWLQTHREMLRWQKTEDFAKWRRKQFLRQGGTCYYCDELLVGRVQQVEHVIPKSKGGTNQKSNLVLSCAPCNKDKNTTLLSNPERKALREKNRKKRGTYHRTAQLYESEEHLAARLREMFRED